MSKRLSFDNIQAHLHQIPDWTLSDDANSIEKRFTFRNFVEAFAFMTRVALMAEKLDHHPDWTNVYNTVDVRLSTHDAGGLTERDFALAQVMDGAQTLQPDNPFDV